MFRGFRFLSSRWIHASNALLTKPTEIFMPALSPTMEHGTITKWLKSEGDNINAGDALCEIETDKAVVTMEAEEDGVLAKILVNEGVKDIKVSTLIAYFVEEGEDITNLEIPQKSMKTPTSDNVKTPVETSSLHVVGPAVRRILDEYVIDITKAASYSTGPGGRLLKGDLLQFIDERKIQPSQEKMTSNESIKDPKGVTTIKDLQAGYVDIELSSMRKTIAKRLTEAKFSIPHQYTSVRCSLDAVLETRKHLLEDLAIKVSVNDFVIKAVALALQNSPSVNATWNNQQQVLTSQSVDISVAVATDKGLITPIVFDINTSTSVSQISSRVKELALKARDGKLQPNEFIGGTFTISNLGMFGIQHFTAIINPPQVGILAVGAGEEVAISPTTSSTFTTVTLSSDARVVTNESALNFMNHFKAFLETPSLLKAF